MRRFVPHDILDERFERRDWFRDDQYVYNRIAASAAAVLRAGGNVGMGCHGEMDGIGCHWELWGMSAGGMTPLEVIRGGTIDGARALGLHKDIGSPGARREGGLSLVAGQTVAEH